MNELSDRQVSRLLDAGLTEEGIRLQLRLLKRGVRSIGLHSPALIGKGIRRLSKEEEEEALKVYQDITSRLDVLKFVPASGAATRMFKAHIAFRGGGDRCPEVSRFFQHRRALPFWREEYTDLTEMELLDTLLDPQGLDLADRPKGSIPFHRYPDAIHTPFMEQMLEGIGYARGKKGIRVHFTIPHARREATENQIERSAEYISALTSTDIEIICSVQQVETDTICLDAKGRVLCTENDDILLRPGGHGALLSNLNDSQADLVFIKNIDNVCIAHKNEATVRYKTILAGLLIQMREKARKMAAAIRNKEYNADAFSELMLEMGMDLTGITVDDERRLQLLDRPYRVCGMVRNEGEPGGGPYWVTDEEGQVSLQIVESAQMDKGDAGQMEILGQSTHFNPVDIVCCTKTLDGRPIDLLAHRDMDACFVTQKSVNGQEATVVEWPGLWNGSMADWNTLFVEVPLSTFNPVKTVNDLFRPAHQP